MTTCSSCQGFLPHGLDRCPNCQAAVPIEGASRWLPGLLTLAGTAVVSIVLSACYGPGAVIECIPACPVGQYCAGQNVCLPEPCEADGPRPSYCTPPADFKVIDLVPGRD